MIEILLQQFDYLKFTILITWISMHIKENVFGQSGETTQNKLLPESN